MARRIGRISGTVTMAATTTKADLLIGTLPPNKPYHIVNVLRVKIKCTDTSGNGTTFTAQISNLSTASTADSMNQVFKGAATAIANLYDATDINGYCITDSSGYLYLFPTPDAANGLDIFSYEVIFEVLF